MSDGTTVYECTSTDEVVDLLQGGQAVFAIAVGRHVRDVEGTLAALPGERATGADRDAATAPPPTSWPAAAGAAPPPEPDAAGARLAPIIGVVPRLARHAAATRRR